MNETNHSPFWICLTVFVALCISNSYQLYLQVQQRGTLRQLEVELFNANKQAKTAKEKLNALIRDLVELSKTNKNAEKIVKDFDIRIKDTNP